MGNHVMAINDFNEAIRFDPENSEAYFRRGLSKYASKELKEAIHDFE
jgi:tetratricopeptide (TPR) repeat protein